MIHFTMCCVYVVSVLPGSVETTLGFSGKFYKHLCRVHVFLPVSTGTEIIKKIDQEKPEL